MLMHPIAVVIVDIRNHVTRVTKMTPDSLTALRT